MSTVADVEGNVNPRHMFRRKALKLTGWPLLALSFQTLGVIYSDIGTSPLYVLNGIWPSSGDVPPADDVIGGVSAIFWSLTLLPMLKYVLFALRFGTEEGEGGTFALYNGIFPPRQYEEEEERSLTGDFGSHPPSAASAAPWRKTFRFGILAWALFGTALTMADGILTPAVSVTSAVGGMAVAKPDLLNDIVPVSIAFLVALFLVQRFGTAKIGFTFAPLTFIWLLLIGISGIANIIQYPGIFRALDPSRAVAWFMRTKNFDYLAGVLLAVTGSEALFANLGQFNMLSIQLSFCLVTYPCLVLAYLGQGSRLIVDGTDVLPNVFYNTIPGPVGGGLYWFTYVFAILATLIASQTMITAVFSLVQQLTGLHSLPQFRMKHTSELVQGQVYIPSINYVLGAGTIILVAAFQNLTNMTNAYGFAVSTVFIVTTTLIGLQIPLVKGWHWSFGLAFFIFFGFFDGIFWGASLRKVPLGAYVPLAIGMCLWLIMYFWTWAKGLEDHFDANNRRNLRHFLVNEDAIDSKAAPPAFTTLPGNVEPKPADDDGDSSGAKVDAKTGALYLVSDDRQVVQEMRRLPIVGVFHKAGGKGIPHSFYGFLKQWPALPRVVIFLNVRTLPFARLPDVEERYIVSRVRSLAGFYGVTYQLGFREEFDVHIDEIINGICEIETGCNPPEDAHRIVNEIREARRNSVTHILPNYWVYSKAVNFGFLTPVVRYVRAIFIEGIYRQLSTIFPDQVNWLLSEESIIRVGVNAAI